MSPVVRRKRLARWGVVVSLSVSVLAACGGTKRYRIASRPPEPARTVSIDGDAAEWRGALSRLEKENVRVGFLNDADFLYICLVFDNPASGFLLRRGFTVWIDPDGGKQKTWGIRYPVSGPPLGPFQPSAADPYAGGEESGGRFARAVRDIPDDLEIVRRHQPEPESRTVEEARAEGLEVKLSFVRGAVYELKIPLAAVSGGSIAVGTAPGGTVGIGFETESLRTMRPMGRTGGMGGGVRPPMGGGRAGGGMGGRPGGMSGAGTRPNMPKPLKMWAEVRLASGPGAQPAAARF